MHMDVLMSCDKGVHRVHVTGQWGYWENRTDTISQLEHVRKFSRVCGEIYRAKVNGIIDSHRKIYLGAECNSFMHQHLSVIPWSVIYTPEFEFFFRVHLIPTQLTTTELDACGASIVGVGVVGGGVSVCSDVNCSSGDDSADSNHTPDDSFGRINLAVSVPAYLESMMDRFTIYRRGIVLHMEALHRMPLHVGLYWTVKRFDYPPEDRLWIINHVFSLYQSLFLIDESYLSRCYYTLDDWEHGGCPTLPC